ncbi:alpha-D-xyloside xylohydrolase [Paenibacillus sp. UNCCL117]|uniref:glycoside hydrolase family 31 protein n=1 Tax=unclassified Paenibacillus TaxID=185978 RepID=UPI00088D0E8C|nr:MULTISPECIES: TIM-barrel domain-containing protein [unclassified Paenibacillus]SDD06919.1 alpha-D-xyloside xylohydrolase [Paenibacillus sp. cl123]SFW31596.1 alpha-D-xyloside xylohydrolase [Paenibacillus sp. UNCCL117]
MKRIANGVWMLRFGHPETHTPVSLRETVMKEEALDELTAEGNAPFRAEELRLERTARGVLIELPLKQEEHIYGFGLQLHRVDHTGRKKVIRVNSDPVADTGDSHAPVPFYVSTAGYGVLVDTSRYAAFYCGTSLPKGVSRGKKLEQKEVGTSEIELYGYQAATGDRTMLVDIPSAQGVDVYFFEGPDMRSAVQRYNLFSGGGSLPPAWGLGIWYRAYSAAKREDIERLAHGFRKDNMPVDVFGFEPGWQTKAYSCSFVWDQGRFPDHEQMLDELYRDHYRVNLWEHLFVHPTSPMYEELLPHSGDYEVWEGLVPDLSVPEARDVFASHHLKEFVEKGIAGFKLDECDSSDFVHSNWSFPDIAKFPSGMDGEQMHNQLGTLYQAAIQAPFEAAGRRTLSQVRASGALAAPFPFVLYSDLYNHKVFIRGVVNSGFSGLLWSPEVRQAESPEDLLRRIQTAVFSPMALLNCWRIPNPPWMQVDRDKNIRGEFLDNYEEIRDLCRNLFEIRMSLIPYLYTSYAKYNQEGLPPFRALVMDYPDDPNTYGIDDAYMMGDSLLVAPIVTGESQRSVYLPAGGWRCFWTGERYDGGHAYVCAPGLARIPVFVKEGTLLPLARPLPYVADDATFEITVRAYGAPEEEAFLYEDDGTTFEYREGRYNWLRLSWPAGAEGTAERSGSYEGVRYKIIGWEQLGEAASEEKH